MSFFVYWNHGGCNYGDHEYGFEKFATLELARKKVAEVLAEDRQATVEIVHGHSVELVGETVAEAAERGFRGP